MIFIRDEEYIRGNCPMTKEEVRILSIAKLELHEDYNVMDIGAGSGSVTVQMSKICSRGKVTAVEMDSEALDVLYKNIEKFNCKNVTVVDGEALQVEPEINGNFHAIFVGGSGGNIEDIIRKYSLKLKDNGIMVLNFITIDNLYKAMKVLKELNFQVQCTQIAVSKTKGKSSMLFANNPIFIVAAEKV